MSNIQFELRQERRGRFALNVLTVSFDELPVAFHGYRMVQLTDFHFGPATAITHLRSAFHIVKELKPHALLYTGDFVQLTRFGFKHILGTRVSPKVFHWTRYRREVRGLAEELGRALSDLTAPDGVYAVFGNHDYHEGIGSIVRKLPQEISWLTNSRRFIEKGGSTLLIAGVDDFKRGKPDLAEAAGLPSAQRKRVSPMTSSTSLLPQSGADPFFRLLLSHNPDITLSGEREHLKHFDLTVCGHTHGGQICLPFWGPLITRTKQKQFFSGLSVPAEPPAIYVNHGVGYGAVGVRILCPPEILLIELKQRP
ncbi:MAG: metallophosphoesterase [Bdellovibrionota bacterium]